MQDKALAARVVAQYRDKYRVRNGKKEFWAEVTGKMMYAAAERSDYPLVGDLVEISELEDDHAVIRSILPRKTLLQRKAAGRDEAQPIAANLDVAFIVQAVDRDFNLNRLDRYLTIVRAGRIEPAFILNKIDLVSKDELKEKLAQVEERYPGLSVIAASASAGDGLKALHSALESGRVYCFVGSSGVGKSSLINKLLGKELIQTREISAFTHKGKHVTTHRELFFLKNGSMVIDNPGMREVGVAEADAALAEVFGNLAELSKECKYADCTHEHEPGCAVLAALQAGTIDNDQYLNYLKLKKEADHYAQSSAEKKQKERGLSRLIKNYHKQTKNQR